MFVVIEMRKDPSSVCECSKLWLITAAELGLPLVPPFMDPATKGSKLLQGVNFASAGSGILNSTGMFFVSRYLHPYIPLRISNRYARHNGHVLSSADSMLSRASIKRY